MLLSFESSLRRYSNHPFAGWELASLLTFFCCLKKDDKFKQKKFWLIIFTLFFPFPVLCQTGPEFSLATSKCLDTTYGHIKVSNINTNKVRGFFFSFVFSVCLLLANKWHGLDRTNKTVWPSPPFFFFLLFFLVPWMFHNIPPVCWFVPFFFKQCVSNISISTRTTRQTDDRGQPTHPPGQRKKKNCPHPSHIYFWSLIWSEWSVLSFSPLFSVWYLPRPTPILVD